MHRPYLGAQEREFILRCLSGGMLGAGHWVEEFEEMICRITGAKHAVATCSGTAALHAALVCAGLTNGTIKIPALTFAGTASAVLQAGMRPHFVEPENSQLPVDLNGIKSAAMGMVRDACQSLGCDGIYGRHLAVLSFNANKIITTGGGGCVVTDDAALAGIIRHRVSTARMAHDFFVEHDAVGWNYRMPDINAAVGLGQLMNFATILSAKKALHEKYREAFASIGVGMWPGFWLNSIRVENRDEVIAALHKEGYKARCLPTPLHRLTPYRNFPKDDLSKTMAVWRQVIQLPSSPAIGMRYL